MLKAFLVVFLVVLLGYTAVVVGNHGLNLFAQFFGDMLAVGWPGQFNLDFMGFLALSAMWTVWRNNFTPLGYALAVPAFLGGMVFLSIYLLFLISKTNGDLVKVLLGEQRSAR